MPLVRFEVKNEYGLGDPELYRGPAKREDPKVLLDGVAVAGLVGILRQLGDLAEFAADVFHDLHEQVMVTAARGHKILNRIQQIEEAFPTLEKAIQGQKSHIHFAYVAGSDWHANLRTDHSHLLYSDLPRFMLDSYEECRDPPRLYLLDKFDCGGTGSCLKRYSDPSYFKHVRSASESDKSVKFPREKKYLKNKRKGSRLRNGEIQHAGPMSQCSSSSTCFASPSMDGQGLSTENISIPQMRLNPELASGSPSSGSKTRLSFIEQVSDMNPSLVSDEIEYDKLSVSELHINNSDSCASVPHDERNGNCADDDSQHDPLQGNVPRTSSVTWDEKTEIVKPTSPKSCDDILVDRVLDPEPLPETSEPLNMDLETAELRALEQEDILLDIPNARLSSSGGNHFDEVTSETDNYMDALNTLESETETDSEYQTKREVKSLSNFGYQGAESGTGKMNGMDAIDSDSSDVETPLASHSSFNKDLPPETSNLISSESSGRVQSPLTTGFASNLDTSVGNDFSEDFSDTSRMKSSEGINNDLSRDSSVPNLQTMLGAETTGITSKSLDPLGMPSAKFWTNGGLLGVEPSKPPDFSVPNIASENIVSGAKNTGCEFSTYTVTSELHTRALSAKSDTMVAPNENMSRNSNYLENMDGSPNTLSSVDQSSLNSDQLFGIVYNVVQPNDPFKCSPFPHDNPHDYMSAMQNTQESVRASSLSQFGKDPDTPDSIFAHTNRHDQRTTNATPGAELPDTSHIDSQSNESGKNTRGISSSFSGLAQRFLANSLERRALHASADTQTPSGVDQVLNADITRSRENSLQNMRKEGPTEVMSQISYEQKTNEKFERRSSRRSISSSSRYSEISSPPLEHMKISFHPMNGLDISKLKLEFPNGNLLEGNEDLMFPSFQLVPGPALPLQDTGFESDDDTFCRSCPYSSEDILSPRSYSNSELWEHEERSGSKDHEIYDDSRRISSSTASNSSFMGFEQTNHCNIHSANEFENLEDKDDAVSFQNGPIIDLPGLDSVISSKHQQTGQCDPLSIDHANSALPNELPPPPPLPPVQWRIMKSSFASGGDMDYGTAAIAGHLSDLQAQRFAVVWQQEQPAPKPPCTSEHMAAYSNKKTVLLDQQKLNGNREANHEVNGNKVDEREELLHQIHNRDDLKNINGQSEPRKYDNEEPDERGDLLHQIRNKTFNLRRTAPAKPSLVPQSTTNVNVNVAAILEKANAIRQACVGSDEGGDDDNWSDG